ncbi:glutathione transferase [Pterulicium gracile]|uniref:glutathione transferase n=1 Tax=Pterulicium gracile TaxID=1884261 RepID=A0A5C3QI87_9AGAR|nr:glutathione transferase [Pterula gracilis]
MVLTLYGFSVPGYPVSTCTTRVAVTLHEKKVPFNFISVDLQKGEHTTAEYTEKQPFQQIPYIVEDDGFTLNEARAINRYIAIKYADQGTPGLVPPSDDLKALAKFDQAVSVEMTNFDSLMARIVYEGPIKELLGLEGDRGLIKTLMEQAGPKLDAYERILSKQKYLAGNDLTIADLHHLPTDELLPLIGLDTLDNPAHPSVARWWNEIRSRPAWKAVKEGFSSVEKYD